MTKVNTTLAKNSDERFSLGSMVVLISSGRVAYSGAIGWEHNAFVYSSRSCAIEKSFVRPETYAAGESKLIRN